jgi:hypothetical protein
MLMWLKANEIFPTHLRSKGATLCIASYSLINIMWTQVSPIAFDNIGWKYYLVFICCCVVASVIIYFTYPDTLNKPLEEVALMFGDEDLVAHYVQEHARDGLRKDELVPVQDGHVNDLKV